MSTTLLTADQIWGDNALDVMKAYGTKVGATDLAALLGAYMTGKNNKTSEGDRSSYSWSASSGGDEEVRCVSRGGVESWDNAYGRGIAARPALPSSFTSSIRPSAARALSLPEGQSVQIVEYGEYPQTIVSDKIATDLERAHRNHALKTTGKKYTFDSARLDDCDSGLKPYDCPEYTLNGKKYVRVEGKPADSDSVMSNGEKVQAGQPYWVEVQPIEWLKDGSGIWVSKKNLFAGVRFNPKGDCDGNFEKTEMASYLKNYFDKQMVASRDMTRDMENSEAEEEEVVISHQSARQKKYGIMVEETPMPIKEQIGFYVQNGMSFMLHGPSGVGKTARVEAIDPDLTAVPLWNGVLPEDVVGKVRYPSGETALATEDNMQGGVWVAPDWYMELTKKCASEPDKKHVLFIDEVTNARPTTQSLIFHIALKKSISPSKGKLPDNCVVVLAGNSKEESGAAYNMPEPLFRRMCGHIHLKADVPEWLDWASEKSRKYPENSERLNIHPLVSSFVATYGEQVFYTSYDEENPKQWALDPRGWEQVSDIIYDNDGVIRRELLESKMGPELAANMLGYAQNPPLSKEEILAEEYSKNDIPDGSDARLALALSLRYASSKEVAKVRDFIGKHLGAENRAIFDSVWVGKSDERALQIAQMQKLTGGRK